MSEYLRFQDEPTPPERKTKVVWVIATRSNSTLGKIAWFGRWRQYAFFPDPHTVFNVECMDTINAKIRDLMTERRSRTPDRRADGVPLSHSAAWPFSERSRGSE